MMDATVSLLKEGNELKIQITGDIVGESLLPDFEPGDFRKLTFVFDKVQYINSAGIRNWILWIAKAKQSYPAASLIFQKFPHVFTKHAASIRNFLPPGSTVESFWVPYVCITCDNTAEKLFTKGQDIPKGTDRTQFLKLISFGTCNKCGGRFEIDAVPEHYLEFQ